MSQTTKIEWRGGVSVASGGLSYASNYGTSPVPSGVLLANDGNTAGLLNSVFETTFSIATGVTQLYDLKGGNGEKDVLNVTLAMINLNGVEIILNSPGAGVSVQFGPQAQTNAAQLWFEDVTANFYAGVRSRFAMIDEQVGWALDATHKVIALKNPGATTVTGWLRVLGRK